MKTNLLKRATFSSNKKLRRNAEVFDAGLHTLHLKQEKNESDVEFVERFLVKYFNGCKNRGGDKYKKFFLTIEDKDDYSTVWGIREHL